jgi:arylsulfatase B
MSRGQDLNADDEPNRQGWPYYAGPDPDLALLPSYFGWPRTVNGVTAWSTTYATTAEVDEAIRFIRGARSSGKPYFLWLALSAPHAPYEKPPNNLHSKDSLPKTGAPRRAYYEAMIEAMDTELGRLLKEVSLADTTVIFLGDNGTPAEVTASPYSAKQAKGTPYEGGVRVPLLVAGAGVVAPNRMVERIVSVVDLYPTILKLAGIEPQAVLPAGTVLDGVSLVPYLQNRLSPALRSFVYAEEFPDCFDRGYERAIASCCYKLIRRADGSRVFYDLKVDPYESRNLLSTRLNATQQSNLATLTAQMDGLLAGATPPAPCAAAAP